MTVAWLAPLMFVSMVAAILTGFPIGLSLVVHGFVFTLVGAALDLFPLTMVQAHMLRVYGLLFNDVLLAIPFFTLMGITLQKSGIAEDMLLSLSKLLRFVRGGLALSVIVVGTVLAATTGVIQASIIAMGVIALPVMVKAGYQGWLATGVITASGTLAQIIPPSLVLIVIADATGVPIFRLYERALVPGLLLAGCYCIYVVAWTRFRPNSAPRVGSPPSRQDCLEALRTLIPPLLIVAATLGSVLSGFATPTESGGFGATASLLLAAARGQLDRASLQHIADTTTLISCCALFVMIGAVFFALPFNAMGGKEWMRDLFAHLPGGATGFLLASVFLVFFLAFFLDFFEIAFIALPLLMPTVAALGIDPSWFAVLVCMVLQTSFMHPPFGVAIYTLRSVAPAHIASRELYLGALPFIAMQLAAAGLIVAFPDAALDLGASNEETMPLEEVERILWELPHD